ncbi:unnamed protein product [marine sediment metagenome]|uniref:Uncharacterized protein n=1 Tax=marine sediment metagenome TaxID=412755 RepID=X1HCJ6_9ZZZZ
MYEKLLLESGKFFIGRRSGIGAKVVDDTEDFTIPVSLPPTEEGKATIISITAPATFTSGVPFTIKPKIRNDGGDDKLYLRIIDKDTNTELKHGYITLAAGKEYVPTWSITLTQTTDFHGELEAGHVE